MKKFFYWLPRVLGVIYILFLTLFSFDVFDAGFNWQAIIGFFIHSIPSLILFGLLVIAWKRPKLGGLGFLIFGLLFMIWFLSLSSDLTIETFGTLLMLSAPIFLIGFLFMREGRRVKK